ncbi:VWA domain-containing protein [Gluconacetobacter sp. 1c LMG 22058]|uniref:VWA domain-containing protein n=1 Tax=Gluconacetobacter dulcium TaxID=2729096 RepID=A0A7W4PJG7_9PROT|nr:vWA domain-containing protein [Gluconacetobacter dulcium]MBB2199778.1 VWA domain-containing protein [Gluconacetobacter dulcium]
MDDPKGRGALASPLAALVARAAASLPTETGATAAAGAQRKNGGFTVILADVSSSMADYAGARRKCDILEDAIAPAVRDGAHVVAFGSYAKDLPAGGRLPPPAGSTALHLALRHVEAMRPRRLVVVSDGRPDDDKAALRAADQLGFVRIDVIYCGPDNDGEALRFMQRLARGGGAASAHDMAREPQSLANTLKRLAGPATI